MHLYNRNVYDVSRQISTGYEHNLICISNSATFVIQKGLREEGWMDRLQVSGAG